MAVADHGWAVHFSVFLLAVALEWGMNCKAAASSLGDKEKPTPKNYVVGQTARMTYKPGTRELFQSSLKFGHWTCNKSIIVTNNYIAIRKNKEKGKLWLRIKNVNTNNSGLYSFMVNGTVLRQWQLHVTEELPASLQGDQKTMPPCGGPRPVQVTACLPFSETNYPNCKSFPGPPLNMRVTSYLLKREPVVQVTWEPPNTGRSDLWGYQVHIVGKDWHPGYVDCVQINNKTGNQYWIFVRDVKYRATYEVFVQSMPALHKSDTNLISQNIQILEKCQFLEYQNSNECCSLINITAEYIDKKIHVEWAMPSQKHCQEIDMFRLRWNNIQKPEPCSGETVIEGKLNYTIHLEREECFRFNYSIKLSGRTNKTKWSKMSKVTVLIPPTTPPTSHGWPSPVASVSSDNTPKILIAVFCSLLGIAVCTLLVVYRVYFQQVIIKLPDPSAEPRPNSDQPLLNCDSGKKHVFILHTRCCDKCNHVVHCLGTVLSSTELIEPSIDMWNTLDISPNVPRWYEDQVKKSDCVIVLGSNKMSRRCQNSLEEGDDPLQIKCQLNFVRGNIAQNPDTHRFIPAFFTCNGSKKDIPDFLSDRWSHKLPKEVDRVIFRVLNVEKIQPHRFQPIVVMGGNGHPFDERKKELERAVQEAEIYHRNNLQV